MEPRLYVSYIARPTATHWREHRPRSLLAAWRESPLCGARRRTALARTEALTRIAQRHAPDEVYADARDRLSEEELVRLTVAIGLISLCNRRAIGDRYIHPIGTSKAA